MNLFSVFRLLSLIFAFTALIAESSGKQRDLSLYEKAGPYLLPDRIRFSDDGVLIQDSIRDFLWRHWRDKRLASLTVVNFTMEGLPIRTTYFVEPDGRNKWSIVLETKVTLLGTKPNSTEHLEESGTSTAYSAERIEVRSTQSEPATPVARSESRDSAAYRLILKDQTGKVMEEL